MGFKVHNRRIHFMTASLHMEETTHPGGTKLHVQKPNKHRAAANQTEDRFKLTCRPR